MVKSDEGVDLGYFARRIMLAIITRSHKIKNDSRLDRLGFSKHGDFGTYILHIEYSRHCRWMASPDQYSDDDHCLASRSPWYFYFNCHIGLGYIKKPLTPKIKP